MHDLTVDNTISIVTNTTQSHNLVSIVVICIILYVLYQVIMLVFLSNKKRKLNKLCKKALNPTTYQTTQKKHSANVRMEEMSSSERQDDIRTLLRGKK